MSTSSIDDPMTRLPRVRKGRMRALVALWLCAGLALIYLDSVIQPYLTVFGSRPWVHAVAVRWQDLGAATGITVFLIAGLLPILRDRGRTFIMFALCAAAAGIAVQIIKNIVGRARPNFVHDQTHFFGPLGMFYHGPRIQLDSMPSGHTTAAFAMAFALAYRWPRFAWCWFLLATGVGISRTLVDRHFPSDVVVASCFGTYIGWAVCTLVFKSLLPRSPHASFDPL